MNNATRVTGLRVWPGVLIAVVLWLMWVVLPRVNQDAAIWAVGGGMVGSLLVLGWWLFFSRASWREKLAMVAVMGVMGLVARQFSHVSVREGGMGAMPVMYLVPLASLGLVAGVWLARRMETAKRIGVVVGTLAIACLGLTAVRMDGVTGLGDAQLRWRWTPTAEEKLAPLAVAPVVEAVPAPAAPVESVKPEIVVEKKAVVEPVVAEAVWPGFRGPGRDGVVRGLTIETDWAAKAPKEMWRRAVGPGWSSFAVGGDLVYTQEQRGESEIVSCYRLGTGEPVWAHTDKVRFWESMGGPGPRGTPYVSGGRVYALGATGLLNALDARTGKRLWVRDLPKEIGAKLPEWGFAGSPVVADGMVVAAASGRLAAYDAVTGEQRWTAVSGGGTYASPQVMTLGGVKQVVLLMGKGVAGYGLADGKELWRHEWEGASMLQPALAGDGDLLMGATGAAGGFGTRRLGLGREADGWKAAERWTSNGLKPYYNDLVVHKGRAYGFDGSILSSIELAEGKRVWKGGRYGFGQMLLLADQDLLLVSSEQGDVALVEAGTAEYKEVAKMKAIEGKTWNHPAVAGDVLLVRNGEEMAAFRLGKR